MKIIKGFRGQGKTTELVKLSNTTGKPIMCMDGGTCETIKQVADDLGLSIPEPFSVQSESAKYRSDMKNGILIDEIDFVLESILGLKVDYVTTSSQIITL